MPTRISSTHRRTSSRPGRKSEQLGSVAFDVADVFVRQVADPCGLNCVDDFSSVAHTRRRVRLHQPCLAEAVQVPIQTRSTDIHHDLQLADRRWTEKRQVAQYVGLSPVAHETDCHLNVRREFWADKAWHGSILPDSTEKRSLFCV